MSKFRYLFKTVVIGVVREFLGLEEHVDRGCSGVVLESGSHDCRIITSMLKSLIVVFLFGKSLRGIKKEIRV